MSAFEKAWALLKQMSDEESQPMYQSTQRQPWTDAMTDALRNDLMTNPNYLRMRSNPDYYFNQDIGRWMPKDDEYYSNKIEQDYGEGGNYSDMSLAEIAEEVGFGPTETPSEQSETSTTNPKLPLDTELEIEHFNLDYLLII